MEVPFSTTHRIFGKSLFGRLQPNVASNIHIYDMPPSREITRAGLASAIRGLMAEGDDLISRHRSKVRINLGGSLFLLLSLDLIGGEGGDDISVKLIAKDADLDSDDDDDEFFQNAGKDVLVVLDVVHKHFVFIELRTSDHEVETAVREFNEEKEFPENSVISLPSEPDQDSFDTLHRIVTHYSKFALCVTCSQGFVKTGAYDFCKACEMCAEERDLQPLDDPCPVCLEQMHRMSAHRQICCKKQMHVGCIARCQSVCPCCRAEECPPSYR